MIGGVSVMQGKCMMGDPSITICSSTITLCSVCGVAVKARGVRMHLMFAWRILMRALPLVVVPALVVTLANSLASAHGYKV